MPKYVVRRPINGISLNGREYLLDDAGRVRVFDSMDEILALLGAESVEELAGYGIDVEEEPGE